MCSQTSERDVAEHRLRDSIASYDNAHAVYAERYREVDFDDLRSTFLAALGPAGRLLDAGCGAGRDLAAFGTAGLPLAGLDRSLGMLREASGVSDAGLVRGDMRSLPFAGEAFAGVWSMASLVHLDRSDTLATFREFGRVLKCGGAVLASMACGEGSAWRDDGFGGRRWFSYVSQAEAGDLMVEAGLEVVSLEVRAGVAGKPWINAVARKPHLRSSEQGAA